MMDAAWSRVRRGGGRTLLAGVGAPLAVTALASLPGDVSPTIAALLYVPAAMGAAVVGGAPAGVVASVLSFLGLNFFFTEPVHTLRVERAEDLVALVVFLVVSLGAATLLSSALREREAALRREREARLLQAAGERLLAGEAVDAVLQDVARASVALFDLARCEVEVEGGPAAFAQGETPQAREVTTVPVRTKERQVGLIRMVPRAGRPQVPEAAQAFARALGSQVALAIEAARLASEASRAQADAEASTLRAALFSAVTHDLRTPLASITAAVTNLLDGSATFSEADRKEALETIREEAERLDRLVGNLMQLARARAGALEPQKRPAAIADVVEGTVARLQPLLRDRVVRLMLRDDIPDVPMDVGQIDQVLGNLLENAAQHAPGSEITVSAARWQRWVEVRVSDHGPGIPRGERERVFEPFVRGAGRDRGTGLGLSIARALVEAHGGRIWIEDAPGGGTCVAFQLPLSK
ncbi:MAG TPA: ATP-binding protein [Actinomycetota bacterium]|nr:ATP-binding protein [Actinomycetota bacterium]